MKKIASVFISVLLLITSFTAVHCEDDIKVTLDGQELAFDVPPMIIDGRTLVPMRAIFEALDAEVEWDGETQTITATRMGNRYNTSVTMRIDDKIIDKEIWDIKYDYDPHPALYGTHTEIELDVPPMIIDGRTLVPVRAVSESLDCDVVWDGESRTVIITAAAEPAPTAEPSTIPIAYDDTAEREAHYIRKFRIKDVSKANGSYVITYTLETFLEGRGTVAVKFNCYDSDGRIVSTFGDGFVGTDYTWSAHESTASISDKTVRIELAIN